MASATLSRTYQPLALCFRPFSIFPRFRISIKALLIFLIITAGIFYLIQVNTLSVQGFKMQDLEKKLQQENNLNKDLKMQMVNLQSMNNLKSSSLNLNLVKISQADYIAVGSAVVAFK